MPDRYEHSSRRDWEPCTTTCFGCGRLETMQLRRCAFRPETSWRGRFSFGPSWVRRLSNGCALRDAAQASLRRGGWPPIIGEDGTVVSTPEHRSATSSRSEDGAAQQPRTSMIRAVLRGGGWSAGGQVLTLAASLLATPFVIRLLGPRYYGLFALLNVLIGYVAFADLGMSAASSKFGADAYAKRDPDHEASVVWTSVLLAATPAGLVSVGLWIGARPIAAGLLHLDPGLVDTAATGLRI